jgi:sulfite dehydrogenase
VARLLPVLAAAALLAAGCSTSKPGGKDASPLPSTIVGTVPKQKTETVPPQFAQGDPVAGKKVFLSAGCTGCHTLKDAGSNGNVGPNLDQAQPSLALVVNRVTNGQGAMPAFKDNLEPGQIGDVAAYVYKATR